MVGHTKTGEAIPETLVEMEEDQLKLASIAEKRCGVSQLRRSARSVAAEHRQEPEHRGKYGLGKYFSRSTLVWVLGIAASIFLPCRSAFPAGNAEEQSWLLLSSPQTLFYKRGQAPQYSLTNPALLHANDMDSCIVYFTCGAINTLLALHSLHQQGKAPQGYKLFLAICIGMTLWPLTLLVLWSERQIQTWNTSLPQPHLWKHERERSGKYTLGRLTVIVKWRPRQVLYWGRYAIFLRPRVTLDAPVLVGKHYLVLTPWLCQLTISRLRPLPPTEVRTPKNVSGFTLLEILIVIAIIGLLAAVLIPNLLGARRVAQRNMAKEFTASCLMTAEKRRSFISNTVSLPGTCAELGLKLPEHVQSATFTLNGDHYDLNVVALDGTQLDTFQERVAVRAK